MAFEELLRKLHEEAESSVDCQNVDLSDLPLQVEYNPFDRESNRAVTTMFSSLLFNGWQVESFDDLLGHVIEKDTLVAEFMESVIFRVRSVMQDAAGEWVRQRYGSEAEHELVIFLEQDNEGVWALAQSSCERGTAEAEARVAEAEDGPA